MSPAGGTDATTSAGDPSSGASHKDSESLEPLACVSCRARKLKCDRSKPACNRCTKVNNECLYPESRRKPTFKRRNVKELEARLAQVEDYLKEVTKNADDENAESTSNSRDTESQSADYDFSNETQNQSQPQPHPQPQPLPTEGQSNNAFDFPGFMSNDDGFFDNGELMGLGISESLPPFEVMEELTTFFFNNHHSHIPIVHPGRYWQSFYGGPLRKPPMCLQYAIWAIAAHLHPKYDQYGEVFYRRARQYAETDEMKGTGEHFITISHAQAYALISTFEAKCMYFTRAALTTAKLVRLVEMMGLDRLDGEQDDLPPTLGPASSWVEMEERRRTFWGAFAIDSHASIATGWPTLIQASDVTTRLPASEDAFLAGKEEKTCFLEDIFTGADYGGFAGTLVICNIFRGIMHHIHRSKPHDHPEDLVNGRFWSRHCELDNQLSSAFMFMPSGLSLPKNIKEPIALHTNLNLHASVICLHHAAIEKAEKYGHDSVKQGSLFRIKASAEEITNIIKLTCHTPSAFRSPMSALSIYCASTVYVYLGKMDPQSGLTAMDKANLEVLVQSMEAVGRVHLITRAFLQQACLDIERNGLSAAINIPILGKYRDMNGGPCSNIPMLARSAIGRHTELSPVLPGRLPLGNPQGKIPPPNMRPSKGVLFPPINSNLECFQPVLGAVSRNINVPEINPMANQSHKRKRMSPGPGLMREPNINMMGWPADTDDGGIGTGNLGPDGSHPAQRTKSSGQKPQHNRIPNVALPDRTNSSASSSPMNRTSGFVETNSESSNTSPGVYGLGNTMEENRVDLRPLQDRVATPIWQTTAEEMFFGQATESMMNAALPADGSDPWGILNEPIDWNTGPAAQ